MWPSRLLPALSLLSAPAAAAADEATWTLLKGGGQVVVMRHAATAPAASDALGPGGCSSQRNLSEAGCEDARRIGAAFRARGIVVEDVRAKMLILTPRGDGFAVVGRLTPSEVKAN